MTTVSITKTSGTLANSAPYLLLSITGQVDESNLADFSAVFEALLADAPVEGIATAADQAVRTFFLDISQLTFINSKVIGYLVSVHTRFDEVGAQMYFLAPNQDILDIIELVGLTQIVPVYDSLQAALAEIG